jgi:murein DD-endopeptidase MepM/ murein hydrolase activator NlpD
VHGLLLVITSVIVAYGAFISHPFHTGSRAFAAPITGLTMPGVSSSIPATDVTVLRPPAINRTLRAEQPIGQVQQEQKQAIAAASATPTAEPTVSQEDAVVRAAAVAPPPEQPLYQVYTVQEGDTVSSIASRFGLSSSTVINNNAEIQDSNFLVLGQSIIIPAADGVLYEVRYGDTLSDIAARYDVTVDAITGFAANKVPTPDSTITEAMTVFVPGGAPPAPAPVASQVPSSTDSPSATPVPADSTDSTDTSSDDSTDSSSSSRIVRGGAESSEGLIWPIVGPISSPYGPSHPLGIDIDGYNLVGQPIAAATGGTVIFSGGNACCSYGLYVVIMSPGGIETLYGHLSSLSVSQGETVEQGERIGIIGSTGYSTGTHLHFEVIDNGVRQNPMNYLP